MVYSRLLSNLEFDNCVVPTTPNKNLLIMQRSVDVIPFLNVHIYIFVSNNRF